MKQIILGAVRALGIACLLSQTMLLAGCAMRPDAGFLSPVTESVSAGSDRTILVATTRQVDARAGTYFNGERSGVLSYASMTVSIPPDHRPGVIEWPTRPPGNTDTNFVVRQVDALADDKAFVDHLNAQLALRASGDRKVVIFVHGYNTLFAEALFRMAQLDFDSQGRGVPVLFSWASRGKLLDYVYDNNSATIARDDLEHTVRLVFSSHAESVNILAHSMGNWVTVEALRQIKISADHPDPRTFGWVILAAPDIDLDVFKSQLRRFGKPERPFFLVISKDDVALGLSNFIAGGKERLGADTDPDELATLGAIVIDLSDVKALDPSNHGKFAQLAAAAPELLPILENGIGAGSAGLHRDHAQSKVWGVLQIGL